MINLQTSSSDDVPVASGFDQAAARAAAEGDILPQPPPRRGATSGDGQAQDGAQGRALEKTPRNRSLPVWLGQEQDVPRR